MKDPFVLQHDAHGTIHRLRKDGETWCGNGPKKTRSTSLYTRRRLSKANAHPKAHNCNTPTKCGAHEKD